MSGIISDMELTHPIVKNKRVKKVLKEPVQPVVEPVPVPEPVVEPKVVVKEKSRKAPRVKKQKGGAVVLSSDDSDELPTPSSQPVKKSNNWINHVKQYRQANPTVSYKDCLKLAKENYTGGKKA